MAPNDLDESPHIRAQRIYEVELNLFVMFYFFPIRR